MISHVIKPQVGWRSHDADAELFTPMFRFGYHEGMHKKHHGKTKDKWEKFVSDLFATQDGFIGKEKTTVKALRNLGRSSFLVSKKFQHSEAVKESMVRR